MSHHKRLVLVLVPGHLAFHTTVHFQQWKNCISTWHLFPLIGHLLRHTQTLHLSFLTGWVNVSHFALARAWQRAAGPHMRWWVTTPILEGKQRKALPRLHAFLSRGSFISLFGLESRRWHSNFHSPNTSSTSSTPQRRILDKRNKTKINT